VSYSKKYKLFFNKTGMCLVRTQRILLFEERCEYSFKECDMGDNEKILVKVSSDTEFVGIDQESPNGFKARYKLTYVPDGDRVRMPVAGGFIGADASGPHFVARSLFCSESFTLSLNQIRNVLSKNGYELELKKLAAQPPASRLSQLNTYEKSKTVGLCVKQPGIGSGDICASCVHLKYNGSGDGCSNVGAVLERYNDGMEYCYKIEETEESDV
jgi:hypothetical protein